jgi:glycosyltransferase involved in cell wall biosynthesis
LRRRRGARAGVNLVGYFNHVIGLGESARKLERALACAGVPHATAALSLSESIPLLSDARTPWLDDACLPFDVTVLWINPDRYGIDVDPATLPGRGLVGRWAWELDRAPAGWSALSAGLCEIWTASRFVRDAVRGSVDVPVRMIPMAIELSAPPLLDRERWGVPAERALFVFMFDHQSTIARKNPIGVVRAFARAFPDGTEATLLIKTINAGSAPDPHAQLVDAAAEHPSIRIVDASVSSAERSSLLAGCDCYVSLHRSEGFGMTIAEAMSHGRPVIATDFGGSAEYLRRRTGYPVKWAPARVGPGVPIYPEDGIWADPDIDDAAALMRMVVSAPRAAARRGTRAQVTARRSVLLGAPRAAALFLLLDDLDDQPHHLLDAGRLRVTVHERLAPVLDVALDRELVEPRTRDLDPNPGVGGNVLRDLRPGQLDPVHLNVTAPA